MIDKSNALKSLCPTAQWAVLDDEVKWLDSEQTCPTDAEIDAEVARLQAEYDNNEYQRTRASAYPSIEEQLDMQYWDSVNGTTTWKDAIQAVKDAHPKPEGGE